MPQYRRDQRKKSPQNSASLVIPRADEAERGFLAIALNKPEVMKDICLTPDDFFTQANRIIFHQARFLYDRGDPVDLVTVIERLRITGDLEDVGGATYLATLYNLYVTSVHVKHYAKILREVATRRKLLTLGSELLQNCNNGHKDFQGILGDFQGKLSAIKDGIGISGAVGSGTLVPLTQTETGVERFIKQEPPPREWLFESLLSRQVVAGIIAAGGSSKSFLMITLAVGLATGRNVLGHFKPERPFRVLCLFAEDPTDEIHRRLYLITKEIFEDTPDHDTLDLLYHNLHVKSIMGQVGPLMALQDGNPTRTPYYTWLKETIKAHPGLDCLMLDPKSRLFGLDENNNDHNTAWVACLEELVQSFGLTVLFTHHVSKQSGGALNQASARGGSALVDACRWIANLRPINEKTAADFEINNPHRWIEFAISKSNYAPQLPSNLYFKRIDGGVLVPVNLEYGRLQEMGKALCELVQVAYESKGENFTKTELLSKSHGSGVRDQMKAQFSRFTRETMNRVIEFCVKQGLAEIREWRINKMVRDVFYPKRMKASDEV